MTGHNSVKDKILLKLKKEQNLTVAQLAEYFSISAIALRRHIHTLERKGLVNSTIEKQSLGRPNYVFALTEKGNGYFPSNYQQFSTELLKDLEELQGKEFVYQLLAKRLSKEKEEYKRAFSDELRFDQKVKKLVAIQEKNGYMPELYRNDETSFTLKQYNCPILGVSKQYSGICGQEVELFADVLSNCKVSTTSSIAKGSNCCSFLIESTL